VEQRFGVSVRDPYRWLERGGDPKVASWVHAQNAFFESTLGKLPERSLIRARVEQLLEIGDISVPQVKLLPGGGERLFFTRRTGKQNQPVLYVRDRHDGSDRVLLDPNALSTDGRLALDWYYPSDDAALLAYGLSEGGDENSTLRIRNVATGQDLPDVITRTRHASVCWDPRRPRFFYTRLPEPGSVPRGEEQYHRRVYEHVLGEDVGRDHLVFGAELAPTDYPSCTVSPRGRWLLIEVHQGWNKSELFLSDLTLPGGTFAKLTRGGDHVYGAVVRDDALYVRTNEGASRYAVYRVDPKRATREHWQLLLPEHASDVLDTFEVVGSHLFAVYSRAGVTRVERFTTAGTRLGDVPTGTLGTTDAITGAHDGRFAYFDFQSFASAPSVHRVDVTTGATVPWARIDAPFDASDFVVVPRTATSKDGTAVPYLVVAHRDTNLSAGANPTVLYGYGGFNVSLQPRFSRSNAALFERGVVYVQANLRGGGELGESWHRAGQLENKQNVFDDFVAVAEHLRATHVTTPDKLAIMGRSNGGLLVAAAVTQRPDLFRAAVIGVPLTDMLRYHHFLLGKLWVPEYGSPDEPEQFRYLYEYSPYHRVKPRTRYPAVLLTTGESDSRVDPMHARKMAAALQFATESDHPVLLRSEVGAGHGAGKPRNRVAAEQADVFTFILWQLGALHSRP
jgi:prolyl oligopeptidase